MAVWPVGILIFYVIYLGLVLPFVCWGAMGQLGQPHPVAHFVFVTPETPAHVHPNLPGLDALGEAQVPPAEPTGQSRPDTLISIILLVFVGMGLLSILHPRSFSRLWIDHNWRSIVLPIPTPPPRKWRMANGVS